MILERLKNLRKPGWKPVLSLLALGVVGFLIYGSLKHDSKEKPVPKAAVKDPALKPVAAMPKMIKWDFPLWEEHKSVLPISPNGSDIIPIYRGLDIIFMPSDTAKTYLVYTSLDSAVSCKGSKCPLSPGFNWISFKGTGSITYWFEPQR